MNDNKKLFEKLKNELTEIKFPQKIDNLINGDYTHIIKILHYCFYSFSKNINKFLESHNYHKKLKYKDKEFVDHALEVLSELFNYKPKLTSSQIFTNHFIEEKIRFCYEVVKIIRLSHYELLSESYENLDSPYKINNIQPKQESNNAAPKQNNFNYSSNELYSFISGLSNQVNNLSKSFQNFQISIDNRISKIENELSSIKNSTEKKSTVNNHIDNGYVFSFANDQEINENESNNLTNKSSFDSSFPKNERKFPITLKMENREIHTKNADELIDRVSNKFKETQKLLSEMKK